MRRARQLIVGMVAALALSVGTSASVGAEAGVSEAPGGQPALDKPARAEEVAPRRKSPARLFGVGVFTRGGLMAYRASGCACVDRSTWRAGLGARAHLGGHLAAELSVFYGMMVLGGNFPLNGWEAAARWQFAPEAHSRLASGLYARLGYVSQHVMGMRDAHSPGISAAAGWSWELVPMLSLEAEFSTTRHLGDMAHWQLGGQLGIATRF